MKALIELPPLNTTEHEFLFIHGLTVSSDGYTLIQIDADGDTYWARRKDGEPIGKPYAELAQLRNQVESSRQELDELTEYVERLETLLNENGIDVT